VGTHGVGYRGGLQADTGGGPGVGNEKRNGSEAGVGKLTARSLESLCPIASGTTTALEVGKRGMSGCGVKAAGVLSAGVTGCGDGVFTGEA
jgi:hypothetical protein